MKKMIKVSVIMPVYNSQQYIKMAIDSVLNQTLKEIELILVNDGSSDGSEEICREYERMDRRVRVYSHENHGISYTRNVGIKNAKGKYIAFIDNDDEYEEDLLEKLYLYAEKNDTELVKFGYRVIEAWHKNPGESRVRTFKNDRVIERSKEFNEKLYEELKRDGFFNMIWNGLYEREFLLKSEVLFAEKIVRGYEDWIFNYQLFLHCEKIGILKDVKYIHYQRENHSTSSKFHENQLIGCVYAATTEQKMFEKLNKNGKYKLNWNKRAIEYFIEYILVLEKPGCSYSFKQKKECLKKILEEDALKCLKEKQDVGCLTKPQIILQGLILKQKIGSCLRLAQIYNRYLDYKRKKN